jgi:hypothetical protein
MAAHESPRVTKLDDRRSRSMRRRELLFEDGQRGLTGAGRRLPYLATGDLRSSGICITRYAV